MTKRLSRVATAANLLRGGALREPLDQIVAETP